ncbi:hypothetical protein D4T97_011370 [Siminovitchia acidinfaciens]|uniref:Uncharacterized protein n=1 Tax=Siminovitchia acidinfaciens TaxID=2321395 RepID=A0A429XZQ1_9BACI|nr:hypothetical protein [Siminovitchia acidinfaciens]RST74266.1 hypothetical protein D4T97_011370 [Siminovitchia acidinfaciens]
MWVCVDHLKEAVKFAKAPHVSKPRCRMRCSLCERDAIVKLHFEQRILQYEEKEKVGVDS